MSFVSRIYCINVRHREDRYQHSTAELQKVGWLDRTEFYRPEKHPTNGHQGCYESHQAVIRLAQKRQEDYILILEDDVIIDGKIPETDIIRFKALRNAADIYYLGQYPIILWPAWGTGLWRCRSSATMAYIINTKGDMAQKIARYPYIQGYTIDTLYALEAVAYTCCPMICFQRPNMSSTICFSSFFAFILNHHRLFSTMTEMAWRILWLGLVLYCCWKKLRRSS